jgi:gamma-glutamyl-gamma-aminobutyrate hydrolase PuuD
MRQPVIGASSIEARDASAAMMLLTAKTEKEFEVVAFSEGLKELNVICGVGDAETITDHPDHNQSHFRIFCVFSVLL